MDAVAKMGRVLKDIAEQTKDQGAIGCAKLVVFANAIEDNPFMAGAFCGAGEPECAINVGVSGPGVVKAALEKVRGASFDVVAETIKKTAFRVTRVGQLVAKEASERLGVPFGIVDLSLAPTPAVGDSVARILEEMGVDVCGMHGTTAALALLNDAVKKGGVMASSQVGGLSGAFIPVSEDEGMVAAAQKGALTLEKLEAMTAVCSVGPQYDRRAGRHAGFRAVRDYRGRSGDRRGGQQDHGRADYTGAGRQGGRHSGIRRPFGACDRDGCGEKRLRAADCARRAHSGAAAGNTQLEV